MEICIHSRYHVTQNPLRKRKTLSRVKQKIFLIWLWAILNSFPQAIFYQHVNGEDFFHSCQITNVSSRVKIYATLRFLSLFVVPTVIIVFCSGGILLAYSTESALALKRRERYRKFVCFVGVLLFSFLVTNLPKNILELVMNMGVSEQLGHHKIILFVSFLLLSWLNYMFTPLIYLLMYNKDLRAELWTSSPPPVVKTINCGLSHIYNQMFNSPMMSSRGSSIVDYDNDLVRRHLLEADDMDGMLMERINSGGSSGHNSMVVDGLTSMFKKRGGGGDKTVGCDENDLFRVLMPNVEYFVNKLNQNNNSS